ncbi:hypothetical protein V1511DRAFT_90872 [Dipodascopsis uninucleata]
MSCANNQLEHRFPAPALEFYRPQRQSFFSWIRNRFRKSKSNRHLNYELHTQQMPQRQRVYTNEQTNQQHKRNDQRMQMSQGHCLNEEENAPPTRRISLSRRSSVRKYMTSQARRDAKSIAKTMPDDFWHNLAMSTENGGLDGEQLDNLVRETYASSLASASTESTPKTKKNRVTSEDQQSITDAKTNRGKSRLTRMSSVTNSINGLFRRRSFIGNNANFADSMSGNDAALSGFNRDDMDVNTNLHTVVTNIVA